MYPILEKRYQGQAPYIRKERTILIPFDATNISDAYSAFTGLIAGFAFAAIFLLIDRVDNAKDDLNKQQKYFQSMAALFVAFVTGGLASFLFAGIAADSEKIALGSFAVSSFVLTIEIFSVLYGISLMFSAFNVPDVSAQARRISFIVIIFTTFRMLNTSIEVGDFMGQPGFQTIFVITITLILTLVAFVFRRRPHWNLLNRLAKSYYLYGLLLTSFLIALVQTFFIGSNSQSTYAFILPLTMVVIAFFAMWTITMLPGEESRLGKNKRR